MPPRELRTRKTPLPTTLASSERAAHRLGRLGVDVPAADEREAALRQRSLRRRVRVDAHARLPGQPAAGAGRAEVGLGRRLLPDGLGRADLGVVAEPLRARLLEQAADRRLGLVVVALAEVDVADAALGVDQVLRGPVLVAPGVPGLVLVVLGDRVAQLALRDRVLHVAGVALEGELGRVDADDGQPAGAVGGVPGAQVGERANAVDARVGPEVDEDNAAAQAGERERLAVEPALVAGEVGRAAEHRQRLALRGGMRGGREAPAAAQLGEPLLDRVGALERAGRVDQHGREVIGQRGLEAHVGVGGDRQGREQHHHAERALERRARAGGRAAAARRASARTARRRSPPSRRSRSPRSSPRRR